jgi:sugar-specific transcriptional regulator TrmB
MIEKQLKNLGFTKNQVAVYLALFEIGKVKANKLMDYTKMHRNLVYTALDELVKRGLISKVLKKGVAVYSPNDPSSLISSIENQKNQEIQTASMIVDELKKKGEEVEREVNVLEGVDGVINSREKIYQDAKSGDDCYVLGISQNVVEPKLEAFWKKHAQRMDEKGVNMKYLYESPTSEEEQRKLDKSKQMRLQYPNSDIKELPYAVKAPIWFAFSGQRMAIGVADNDPLTFSIKSKPLVDGFKNYFDYFWNMDVKTYVGWPQLKRLAGEMVDSLSPGEEYLILGANYNEEIEDELQKVFSFVHEKRKEKKIKAKLLFYKGQEKFIEKYEEKYYRDDPMIEARLMRTESGAPMEIWLYKDRTVFSVQEKEPVTIVIDKKSVTDSFRAYFDMMWRVSK